MLTPKPTTQSSFGMGYLPDLIKHVKQADWNANSEAIVREVLSRSAHACPLPILLKLAECLIEQRKQEINTQTESN